MERRAHLRHLAAGQPGPGQPVHRELDGGVPAAASSAGGSPVFQSTTVTPPSGSAKTASMRPRTIVSPSAISNGTSTSTGVRAAHGEALNASCNTVS